MLQGDLKNAKAVLDEKAIDPADAEAVTRAASDKFWQDFDKDPFDGLEFLENRIASQAADADLLFLNYVGTDFQAFQKSFDRMKIVEGTMVPSGKRGFLFAKQVYEDQLKLKAARRLDKIKEGVDSQGETIATDPDLKRMVRENTAQVREILLQLDAQKTIDFRAKLQRELGSQETDVGKLLAAFFQTDDQNFHQRYDFFYKELAPSLELYRVRDRRRAHHQGLHPFGLRAVGERPRLRHLPVPGAGEVDAGRRAQLDGHGLVPRALRLHERREAGRDPGAAEGSRRARGEPRERRGRAVRQGGRARGGARGQGAPPGSRRPPRRASRR